MLPTALYRNSSSSSKPMRLALNLPRPFQLRQERWSECVPQNNGTTDLETGERLGRLRVVRSNLILPASAQARKWRRPGATPQSEPVGLGPLELGGGQHHRTPLSTGSVSPGREGTSLPCLRVPPTKRRARTESRAVAGGDELPTQRFGTARYYYYSYALGGVILLLDSIDPPASLDRGFFLVVAEGRINSNVRESRQRKWETKGERWFMIRDVTALFLCVRGSWQWENRLARRSRNDGLGL